MSDIGGLGNSAFDATFFRIEWVGMGILTAILLAALLVWFSALRELPAQLSFVVLGLGLFLGALVPCYWNAEYATNGMGGSSRLLSAAPLSVFNGVLASIGVLALMPPRRRALALGPAVGAVLVWLPSLFR